MLTRWLLKTVAADGAADGDFVWPLEVGAEVTAPDWDPTPVCGGGLHGLLDGRGNGSLINWSTDAVWIVAEIPDDETVVDLDGKVKVRRCIVRHVGDKTSAPEFLAAHGHTEGVVYGTATAGYYGTATAGDYGAATAGDYGTATAGVSGTATAGNRGTATAGDYGAATAGYYGTATAGEHGTATAGDYGTATAGYRGAATAGVSGTATAGNDGTATAGYDGTATAGNRGTATAGNRGTATAGDDGTATAGVSGTATAGERGTIIIAWWDSELGRRRWVVGEVGIDGIVADTPYRVVDGALVEVES